MAWKLDDDLPTDAEIKRAMQRVCTETARDVLKGAQAAAPVDSSALRESGYVVSPHGSGYGAAAAKAKAVNPQAEIESEFPLPDYDDGVTGAVVDFAANHASFIHDGHMNVMANRYIKGRPFLSNEIHAREDDFTARQAQALIELGIKVFK